MTIEPPQPPTAPAPAVRPTPPTPPRIDMSPFSRDRNSSSEGNASEPANSPEAQARDAVAHGSGALTKRTVERNDAQPAPQNQSPPNQTVTVIPPDAPLVPNNQSDYDRGQDVLREFRDIDARSTDNPPAQTLTEQPPPNSPRLNHYQDGHGAIYWLFTIIFMAVTAFVVVKKFLLTDKPALTKSQLFEDSSDRLKAATEKVKPVAPPKPPPVKEKPVSTKTARLPKKDDDKGKHFEVRI